MLLRKEDDRVSAFAQRKEPKMERFERDPDHKLCGWDGDRLFKLMRYEKCANCYLVQLFECVEMNEDQAKFHGDMSLVGQMFFICRGNFILSYSHFLPGGNEEMMLEYAVMELARREGNLKWQEN
jgi:hypothetical protein